MQRNEIDRRTFLARTAAFLSGSIARNLLAGTAAAATASTAAQAATNAAAAQYGTSVRQQVFEVIVRQGLAGAPWREICAGPMRVNAITEREVDEEIERRRQLLGIKPQEYWVKRQRSTRQPG